MSGCSACMAWNDPWSLRGSTSEASRNAKAQPNPCTERTSPAIPCLRWVPWAFPETEKGRNGNATVRQDVSHNVATGIYVRHISSR